MSEQATHSAPGHLAFGDDREQAIRIMEVNLGVLWRRTRADAHRAARLVHPDLDPGAYVVLGALQRRGSLRLTDLAAEICAGKPSASRQVSQLESLGMVRRDADPADGRAQSISLTPEGARQLHAAQSARQRIFHDMLDDWTGQDLASFAALLARLNESYAKDRN
ncbi:MarR family winged helix-turn-helix transcriptional regulator [Zafaria cholistanensis]|nr:MarR family transcriptional regulator [Zafaria cholistanensis]